MKERIGVYYILESFTTGFLNLEKLFVRTGRLKGTRFSDGRVSPSRYTEPDGKSRRRCQLWFSVNLETDTCTIFRNSTTYWKFPGNWSFAWQSFKELTTNNHFHFRRRVSTKLFPLLALFSDMNAIRGYPWWWTSRALGRNPIEQKLEAMPVGCYALPVLSRSTGFQ